MATKRCCFYIALPDQTSPNKHNFHVTAMPRSTLHLKETRLPELTVYTIVFHCSSLI